MSSEPTRAPTPSRATGWEQSEPPIAAEQRDSLREAEADAGYRWATAAAAGRAVLDFGCGAGHGSALLRAAGAESVLGLDRSEAAIELARAEHGEVAEFRQAGAGAPVPTEGGFGLVVCLEEIEKAAAPGELVEQLAGALSSDGVLLLSLPTGPRRDPIDGSEIAPAISAADWAQRLSESFSDVRLYRRRLALGAAVVATEDEAGPEAINWLGAEREEDRSVLAAAANQPLPDFSPTATLVGWRDLRAYQETLAAWEQRARRAEAAGAAKHWELVASREAQRRLRKRLWQLEHRPLKRIYRVLRGRPARLGEGPPLRPPEADQEPWA